MRGPGGKGLRPELVGASVGDAVAPGSMWYTVGVRVGVVFPQTEIGADPGLVREYALEVERLGYLHIAAYDHVLGADPAAHPGWSGPYDVDTQFHEPMVLFGYLAAITSLELVTSILILPQRQTALVAKQAAQVSILTGGHFRLGVGLGWNRVEYRSLDQPFERRGRRLEEQIALLRRLWSERSVTHEGRFDRIDGAGLAPLPPQRPIPIWIGGSSEPALRRVGRLGDGWFPQARPGEELERARQLVEEGARGAGRDPSAIGMEGRLSLGTLADESVAEAARSWLQAGASHLSVNTMGAGLASPGAHLRRLAEVAPELGLGTG